MHKTLWDRYSKKLHSEDEVANREIPGDWVYYRHFVMNPISLDEALSTSEEGAIK